MGRSPSGRSEDEAGVFGGPACLFSAPSLSGIPGGRPRRQAPESPSQGATVPLPGPWANQGWLSLPSENVLSNDTYIVNSSNNKEQNCEKERCDLGIPPHAHLDPSPWRQEREGRCLLIRIRRDTHAVTCTGTGPPPAESSPCSSQPVQGNSCTGGDK